MRSIKCGKQASYYKKEVRGTKEDMNNTLKAIDSDPIQISFSAKFRSTNVPPFDPSMFGTTHAHLVL